MARLRKLVAFVRVPRGAELRLLCAAFALAVSLPRLPFAQDILPFAVQRFGSPEVWGLWFTLGGLALFVTCYRGRLRWYGRVVAGIAVVAWVALATASISATSILVDTSLAVAMLWEAGTSGTE